MNYLNLCFFYNSFADFLYFVVHPRSTVRGSESLQFRITASIFLFLIKFAFTLLIASVIGLFYEPQNLTDQSMSDRFSPLVYFMVGGMILPFFEEILFRLSLVFKPLYLSLSFAFGCYYVLTKLVFGSKLSLVDETFYIRVSVGLAVGLICFLIFRKNVVKEFF